MGNIIMKKNLHRSWLVPVLQDIQTEHGYLSEDALQEVSEKMKIPLIDVVGVATFYKSLSLIPRGKHHVQVCTGTACHVRGAPKVLEEFERDLGVCAGETTEDREFSLETVNCIGACALGPIAIVDHEYLGQVKAIQVKNIVKRYRKK